MTIPSWEYFERKRREDAARNRKAWVQTFEKSNVTAQTPLRDLLPLKCLQPSQFETLRLHDVHLVGDLAKFSEQDLMKIPRIGIKLIHLLRLLLGCAGLQFIPKKTRSIAKPLGDGPLASMTILDVFAASAMHSMMESSSDTEMVIAHEAYLQAHAMLQVRVKSRAEIVQWLVEENHRDGDNDPIDPELKETAKHNRGDSK